MTDTTTTRVLHTWDLTALAEIAAAAQQSAKVEYLNESGDNVVGEVRAFVESPLCPTFLGNDTDVRDAYLWVTTEGGWEVFPSVRHLMKMVHEGGFVVRD